MRELARAPARNARESRILAGSLIGGYRVIETLGSGGMGVVFRARDERLGRDIALKLISAPASSKALLRRFEREARALAALSHTNVVTVHSFGQHRGKPFLVLELVEGTTLRTRLVGGRLPPARAWSIGLAIARGLSAAHHKGIVHRDLKPENVIVGDDGAVKILDFGLAKLLPPGVPDAAAPAHAEAQSATQAGALVGTVHYMSPEQVRGQPVDHRTDLFSFGAVLYEMLTGERAFTAASAVETMHAILSQQPTQLAVALGDSEPGTERLRAELMAIAGRCLEKQARDRYADARELVAALEQPESSAAAWVRTRWSKRELMPSETQYARSGNVHIAYQVTGSGPIDLLVVPGFVSQVEHWWEEAEGRRLLRGLARFSRLILFDKRGTGLSDRVSDDALPALEQRMDDLRAVLDAAGSRRAVVFAASEGGPLSIVYAARYPERVAGLVLYGTSAIFSEQKRLELLENLAATAWGTGRSLELFAPSVAGDPRWLRWAARWERLSASPGAARAILRMARTIDVRELLPALRVPTLVLHRTGDLAVPIRGARLLASKIPAAELVELPGQDHLPFCGDVDSITQVTERFVQALGAGQRQEPPGQVDS